MHDEMEWSLVSRKQGDGDGYGETDQLLVFQDLQHGPGVTSDPTTWSESTGAPVPGGNGLSLRPSKDSVIIFTDKNIWSSSWKTRVLAQDSTLNYVAIGADITTITWLASKSLYPPMSDEVVIASLTVGRFGDFEDGKAPLLSQEGNGQRNVTIQIKNWLKSVNRRSPVNSGASPGDYMRLKVEWIKQEELLVKVKGNSTSGLFTVAWSSEDVGDKWNDATLPRFNDIMRIGGDEPGSIETVSASPSTSTTSPTLSPLSTAVLTAESSGPSISAGAIAGIAVGCGIGLILLVGALVWFLISRRRRHSNRQEYDANDKATAFIDDKNGVSNVATSPQSLLSEDNAHGGQTYPVHPVTVPFRSERHIHDDTASNLPGRAVSRGSVDDRDESSHNASCAGNFAERGMTDEERRRWEEEERHLDDEIARNRGL